MCGVRKEISSHLSQSQTCSSRIMLTTLNKLHRTAGTFLLLLLGLSLVAGVILSPYCSDGMWEVLANQETYFNCTVEGKVQWTLQLGHNKSPIILASCTNHCILPNTYKGLFSTKITAIHKTTMIINPVNNSKLYDNVQLLNGSLECSHGDNDDKFAGCGLNLVYPPSDVSCTASNSSWSINVSCVIGSVYSSRKLYTCSLIRTHKSEKTTLETVTMVTSPTSEWITKSEVKVSGSCQFNTTLPPQEGHYEFIVSVLTGGQNFMTEHKQFTVERPSSPTISCDPQPHVLENTLVNCICSTTSLGQPAGYLRWVIGNQTKEGTTAKQEKQELTSKGLHYIQVLTLSDHDNTWFRCDIIWGDEEIRGENYTARVGYAPKPPHLFFNKLERNHTVKEKDQVNFMCESDGRPTPNVSIYNNDNDTVIIRNSSPVSYTFIARCEDTATYTCSAWNKFSSQSDATTSYSLNMDVNCKPRSLSSTHLGMVKFENKRKDLSFDVIAYPVPLNYDIWFDPPVINNSETFSKKVEGLELNVICKASSKHLYLSRCTLTILRVPFGSDGFYILQIINEHGEENFTVEIRYAGHEDLESFKLSMAGGVVSLVVVTFTILVLIVVRRKLKNSKGDRPSQAPEGIYKNLCNRVYIMGANISCPDTFIDGQESSVTYIYNKTAEVEDGCLDKHTKPLFDLTTKGTDSFVCVSQSASTDTQSSGSCQCVESSSGLTTCTLRLKANRTKHEGGLVTGKLCTLKNDLNNTTCKIKFSNHSEETSRNDVGTEEAIRVVLTFTVLLVVITLVIILYQCRRI